MSASRYPKRMRIFDDVVQGPGRLAGTGSARHQSSERGKRLLPAVVDELARVAPTDLWISLARGNVASQGFEDINYGRLSNAVNRTARWLQERVPESETTTAAYLGPSDARYPVLMLAASKAGLVMFLPSPFNAMDAQRELLEATGSSVLLHAASHSTSALEIAQSTSVRCIAVPEQTELLDETPVDEIAFPKKYEEERSKPFVILHTSGTTSTPKPISLPHGYYAYEDLSQTSLFTNDFDAMTSAATPTGTRCLVTAPMWHAGGIFFGLLKPLLNQVKALLPPVGLPITADLVHACLSRGQADVLQTAPSVAADLAGEPRYAPVVKALQAIIIGSGPMEKAAGDQLLALQPKTLHFFGATETDLLPLLRLDDPRSQWQYHRFHPHSGAVFEDIGGGLHELVIKRVPRVPQPCFEVFPDIETYRTKDVFVAHPSSYNLWRFEGRLDDVITFSTGEKISPLTMETAVASIPGVRGALVVGQGRTRPALLVEQAPASQQDFDLSSVWLEVQMVNQSLPAFGRIQRSLVLLADTSFERTPKGTVRRSATEKKLQEQVEAAYQLSARSLSDRPTLGATTTADDVLAFVHSAHASVADIKVQGSADIFASGLLDSLKVAKLVHLINQGLKQSSDHAARATRITPGHLYAHRSVPAIAGALHADVDRQRHGIVISDPADPRHRGLLRQHLKKLPSTPKLNRLSPNNRPHLLETVLLTGSTGALGTHLLHALLRDDRVRHVHCVDRSPSARQAYLDTFPSDVSLLDRVSFHGIQAVLHLSSHASHTKLSESVTTVIHNAWPVNFQMPLEAGSSAGAAPASLDTHVDGLTSLLQFVSTAKHRPRLVFISTLAAVLRCKEKVPEHAVDDHDAPESSGYARSKWMGEQIVEAAAQSNSVARRPMIIRMGQIAGPLPHVEVKDGSGSIWDPKQTLPSLILSSKTLKALPDSLGEKTKLRWIPVDVCARIILELAGHPDEESEGSGANVYNITNLYKDAAEVTWNTDMLPVVKKRLVRHSEMVPTEILPLKEWVARMLDEGPTPDNPAFKLLHFFEDLAASDEHAGLGGNIDIGKAVTVSQTFRDLGPVKTEWMEYWMDGWGL